LGTDFVGHQPRWIKVGGAGFVTFGLAAITLLGVIISNGSGSQQTKMPPIGA
jgi:hypothetical protein